MKKRLFLFSCFAVVFAFLLLNTLSAVTEETPARETELPTVISDLLSGKNTDLQSALSTLEETDFPLALTTCEVLHHKALHQDIKTSPKAVEAFKAMLQKRLETSQAVSFKQTSTCIQKIPAREVVIEGKHLTIPEHYLAPIKLAITGFSPTGEAGTLLPDIQVSFTGGKAPIAAKVLLDGKEIVAKAGKNSFIYRPHLQVSSILKVGTHKVETVLTDAAGMATSASWTFTVGLGIAPPDSSQEKSVVIASFGLEIREVFPEALSEGSLQIVVRETIDGKRFLEYLANLQSNKGNLRVKTSNLTWLNRLVHRKLRERSLVIKPATPVAFKGNSLVFIGSYLGPGVVLKHNWFIHDEVDQIDLDQQSVSWQFKGYVEGNFSVEVREELPETGEAVVTYYEQKWVQTPNADLYSHADWYSPYLINTTGTGSIFIYGNRELTFPESTSPQIIEGSVIPLAQGKIQVKKARWKIVAGNSNPEIENPLATETYLHFSDFGFAEAVPEIVLSLEWAGEQYEGSLDPTESALAGIFKGEMKAEFEKLPKGIIAETTRKIKAKTIAVTVNGVSRTLSESGQLTLKPPQILAKSEMFPRQEPLAIYQIFLGFQGKGKDPYWLDKVNSFDATLFLNSTEENLKKIDVRGLAYVNSLNGPSSESFIKSTLEHRGLTMLPWFSVPVYSSQDELVAVSIEPKTAEIGEDQTLGCSASIVPVPGLGSGKITNTGGKIDLLEGYESQGVKNLSWLAEAASNGSSSGSGEGYTFTFEPQHGTGTYRVLASAAVSFREKDSSAQTDVSGGGFASIKVLPAGFRILSPVEKFVYPVDGRIQVVTNMDMNVDEWKKIEWFLDGAPFDMPAKEPPGILQFRNPGNHRFAGRYENPSGATYYFEVSFSIKPITVSISPSRRVLPFEKVTNQLLTVKAVINGHEVETLGEPVDWSDPGQTAKVIQVEWVTVSNPEMTDTIKPLENRMKAEAQLNKAGALTALATITVAITKTGKPNQKPVSYNFAFPAVRADLWSVTSPEWAAKSPQGHLPEQAIAAVGRTFEATSGDFTFMGGSYKWDKTSGFKPTISLSPAFEPSEENSLKATDLNFSWKTSEDQESDKPSFVALFQKVGSNTIELENSLVFGNAGQIHFSPWKQNVDVTTVRFKTMIKRAVLAYHHHFLGVQGRQTMIGCVSFQRVKCSKSVKLCRRCA